MKCARVLPPFNQSRLWLPQCAQVKYVKGLDISENEVAEAARRVLQPLRRKQGGKA